MPSAKREGVGFKEQQRENALGITRSISLAWSIPLTQHDGLYKTQSKPTEFIFPILNKYLTLNR